MRCIIVTSSISFFFFSSCLEPFEYRSEAYEQVLVIDALLTNETKSHLVTLSYTYPLDSGFEAGRVDGATIYIEDEEGVRFDFYNEGNGVYQSLGNVQGQEGHQYRLVVTTPDNREYQSSYELLKSAPPIDSIYDFYAEAINEETNSVEKGIQFFLDSHDESEESQFFRYIIEETYKIVVPYPSSFEVIDDQIIPREEEVGYCYNYVNPTSLLIGTSAGSTENRIQQFPLNFVFETSQKLRSRYSLLAKQYSISEDAYLYYRKLKENNESTGSLSDKQTGTIIGNISGVTDPNEVVLGFFEVSGVTERRDFFNASDYHPDFNAAPFHTYCRPDQAMRFDYEDAINFADSVGGYEIHYIEYAIEPGSADSVVFHRRSCTNCSYYADTEVPSYWID
ncbi:MAG: DUF4249 domain-containing protein [Reichenbachiella sp.]